MAKRQTDAEQKAGAIARWNNEGGAPPPAKRPKRPRDPNQLGKLIVDISVGDAEDKMPVEPPKNEAAAALGRLGGAARAKTMSPERRAEIAREAARKRWRAKS